MASPDKAASFSLAKRAVDDSKVVVEHELLADSNFIGSVCKSSWPTNFSECSGKISKEFLAATLNNLGSLDAELCSLLSKELKSDVGLDEITTVGFCDVAGGARLMMNIP